MQAEDYFQGRALQPQIYSAIIIRTLIANLTIVICISILHPKELASPGTLFYQLKNLSTFSRVDNIYPGSPKQLNTTQSVYSNFLKRGLTVTLPKHQERLRQIVITLLLLYIRMPF